MGVRAAALLLIVSVMGCSSAPSFAVPAPRDSGFTINVFDQSGLVTAAQYASPGQQMSQDEQVIADPANSQLAVRWIGGVCHFGPAVTVSGTASALHVRLEPNAGGGLPMFESCAAAARYFSVTLTLSQRVEQGAITVEVRQ